MVPDPLIALSVVLIGIATFLGVGLFRIHRWVREGLLTRRQHRRWQAERERQRRQWWADEQRDREFDGAQLEKAIPSFSRMTPRRSA